MRFRSALLFTLVAAVLMPAPARAQKVIDVTVDMLDRFFKAYDTEKSETKNVAPQLADVDGKINKFEQCKRDWEAAGAASGSKLGGFAARMAIRAKCGSSDADGFRKDRQKIMDGPENAAASAGGFKLGDYRDLRDRLRGYAEGDESGFSKSGLDLLKGRKKQLASLFGVQMSVAQAGGGRGMRGADGWNTDYAWLWISQLFAVQYLSGATMFEKDYKPGEWTRWQISTADNSDETQVTERAFLGRTSEGGEWWRLKTINNYGNDDKKTADTVALEALFKPEPGNDYVQKLVRMRGKLPGNTEAQEMMVPEQWSMWNMQGAFQMKPTKESIDGATIGVEEVKTPAGSFKAKHVRFGQGGGTMDWWLDENAVGGWVKFAAMDEEKKPRYTMELVGRGVGAKSELGVTFAPGDASAKPAAGAAGAAGAAATSSASTARFSGSDIDALIKGLNAVNAEIAKDSTADAKSGKTPSDAVLTARPERYHKLFQTASSLSETKISTLLESMRAYFEALKQDGPEAAAQLLEPSERAIIKPRATALRKALVHVDEAW